MAQDNSTQAYNHKNEWDQKQKYETIYEMKWAWKKCEMEET